MDKDEITRRYTDESLRLGEPTAEELEQLETDNPTDAELKEMMLHLQWEFPYHGSAILGAHNADQS
jgi:hypothetical protein